MIERPERYIADFYAAGSDYLIIHYEGNVHLDRTLNLIKEYRQSGISIVPLHAGRCISEILHLVDLLW